MVAVLPYTICGFYLGFDPVVAPGMYRRVDRGSIPGNVLKLWKMCGVPNDLSSVANRINNFRTRPIHKTT